MASSGGSALARRLPISEWARRYPRSALRGDLAAGVTVAVLLVPQGMAYAGLAGMPPETGLYAAIAAIVVYAALGTSGSLAVGPVAVTSLLTLSGLQAVVAPEDPAYPAIAALLALLVGAVLLLAGLARGGFVVNLLSEPVISGFISAASIIIVLTQLDELLGVDVGRPEGVAETIAALVRELDALSGWTLLVGALVVAALLAGKRYAPRLPVALPVLVVATLAAWAANLPERGVAVVGEVPAGLPSPALPPLELALLGDLAPVALTIAVVAFAEGVGMAKAIARRTRERIDADQELIATGAANAAAGMFGGFPVAGGFARTAVNFDAGARTPLASLITAAGLVVVVLWLTPSLADLPRAALAAVAVVAVVGLIDLRGALETWRTRRSDFTALAITFAATLAISVEAGLAIGVAFSLGLVVYRLASPHAAELGRVQGASEYRSVDRWPTLRSDRTVLLRLDGPLFFASAKRLVDRVGELVADHPAVRDVVLDASGIGDLDSSGAHALADLDQDLSAAGVTLRLATVRGPVRDVMGRAGLWDKMSDRVYPTVAAAVEAAEPGSALARRAPGEQTCWVL